MKNNNFSNFIKNKRVCLIGPSPSVVGSKQGGLIDSFDVVVRVNKAIPISNNLISDIGTKTDVLYNCLNVHENNGGLINLDDHILKNKIKWICCPYPEIHPFDKDIKKFRKRLLSKSRYNDIGFYVINKALYLKASREMNTRPNSGIGSLIDLMSHSPRELYVAGFTFFKGGYYNQYRKQSEKQVLDVMKKHGNHSQEPQILFVKKHFFKNKNFKCDKAMEDILKEL